VIISGGSRTRKVECHWIRPKNFNVDCRCVIYDCSRCSLQVYSNGSLYVISVKSEVVSVPKQCSMKAYRGIRGNHVFLAFAVSLLASHSGNFVPWERGTGTHWIGIWVDPMVIGHFPRRTLARGLRMAF
jgi:hypothetical protein